MVKLIVTDVDDTLVPEAGSEINPEYYDIIRECRKRGIIFGVASGRQKPCVRKLFEPVLDEIFILADNGTDIFYATHIIRIFSYIRIRLHMFKILFMTIFEISNVWLTRHNRIAFQLMYVINQFCI